MPPPAKDERAGTTLCSFLQTTAAFVFSLSVFGCESFRPTAEDAARFTLEEARQIIQRERRWYWSDGYADHSQSSTKFTADRIELLSMMTDGKRRRVRICPYQEFSPYVDDETINVSTGRNKGATMYSVNAVKEDSNCSGLSIGVPTMERAKVLSSALLRWKQSTLEERRAWFAQQQTTELRGQSRTLPEEVRRHRIMAEEAVREMRFSDAIDLYLEGLKHAPWWPEGHFNVALVYGELYFYDDAIMHMRKYLALAPNARDARAAQNKIYAWEGNERSFQ